MYTHDTYAYTDVCPHKASRESCLPSTFPKETPGTDFWERLLITPLLYSSSAIYDCLKNLVTHVSLVLSEKAELLTVYTMNYINQYLITELIFIGFLLD